MVCPEVGRSVPNDSPLYFSNCALDVIQVLLFCATCTLKKKHMYTTTIKLRH